MRWLPNGVSTLKKMYLIFMLMIASFAVCAQSDQPKNALPELENLQTLGQTAQESNLPILLMFSATWCDFCQTLKTEVLNPMILGGQYEGHYMLMRQVTLDSTHDIPGFDGKPLNKRLWSEKLGADLTPTLIFIDGKGQEIAPRIIGISNIELYAALIHQRLNIGYQTLKNPIRLPAMPEQMK